MQLELDEKQLDVVIKALNQACQGIEAASVVLPVFSAIQQQIQNQAKKQTEESKAE